MSQMKEIGVAVLGFGTVGAAWSRPCGKTAIC